MNRAVQKKGGCSSPLIVNALYGGTLALENAHTKKQRKAEKQKAKERRREDKKKSGERVVVLACKLQARMCAVCCV